MDISEETRALIIKDHRGAVAKKAPVIDGLEASQSRRRLYVSRTLKCPPVVAVTANAFEEDRRQCLDAGMDDYLTKPFDRDDLNRLLDRWCSDKGRTEAA